MSTLRPPTAFELFLQRRQQAAADANGSSEPRRSVNAASAPEDLARALPAPPPHLPAAAADPGKAPAAALTTAASAPVRPLALGALRASQGRALGGSGSGGGNAAAERASGRLSLRRSVPDLVPEVVASLPSPRLGGGGASGVVDGGSSGTTAVYGELATAAASLASAANKLARGSNADRSVAASYENLAQAAADLAASACMIRPLTSSASGGIGPLGYGGVSGTASRPPPVRRPSDVAKGGGGGGGANSSALPRAVDPMAAAAAAAAAGAAPESASSKSAHLHSHHQHRQQQQPQHLQQPQQPQHPQHQQQQSPARPATGSSSAGGRSRVYAPRFPGYNPLIHLMESGLPPPGSAAALRPTTSSPITHQLLESRASLQPSAPGNASAASHLSRCRRRSSSSDRSGLGGGGGGGPSGGAAAAGGPAAMLPLSDLSRLPVLSMGPDGQPSYIHQQHDFGAGPGGRDVWFNEHYTEPGGIGGGGGPAGGGGGGGWNQSLGGAAGGVSQLADPHSLLAPYNDVRISEWPPAEPLTAADIEQDEVDMRYNKVLAALRERMYARGPARLAAAFRDLDRDGCGLVSRRDFAAVLQDMNLGAAGLIDEKVVDLMLASVDGGAGGAGGAGGRSRGQPPARVAYGDFVNALRFGTLPWRGYNRKLRHRTGGDPDQPIGPPQGAGSPPPYSYAYGNNSSGGAAAGGAGAAAAASPPPPLPAAAVGRMGELRSVFRQVDHNGDGVVEWSEFREALRRVGEQNRLHLTDQELLQIYKDADPDFSTGVDYEAFMAAYGSVGGAVAAAATGQQPGGAVTAYGGGGVAAAQAGGHRIWNAQWRPQALPRAPAASTAAPSPLTPLTPSYSQPQLGEMPYGDVGGGLRASAPAPRPSFGIAAGGAGFGVSSGGGTWDPWWRSAPGWGPAQRPEAFREMRMGATAMLRRLGSAGGGRAAARA